MDKIEYRIVGRFRKDSKKHIVDFNRKWKKQDVEKRLRELTEESQKEIERKCIRSEGLELEYYSEYDLLDLEIQSRKVSKWQ